jgi:hypothetical protein
VGYLYFGILIWLVLSKELGSNITNNLWCERKERYYLNALSENKKRFFITIIPQLKKLYSGYTVKTGLKYISKIKEITKGKYRFCPEEDLYRCKGI